MRKPKHVRPLVAEALEERLVPSAAGAATTPQSLASSKLTAAFSTFDNSFLSAVQVDLVTPVAVGGGENYTFFADQLGQSLTTLNAEVAKVLGPNPAASPAAPQIRNLILGNDAGSLRTRLSSLSLSFAENGSATTSYENEAMADIRHTFTQVKQIVSTLAATPGAAMTVATTASPADATHAPRLVR